MLLHILDHHRAGISEDKIASIWKISSVPIPAFIYATLRICSNYWDKDHLADNCPGSYCSVCADRPCTCACTEPAPAHAWACFSCGSSEHVFFDCPTRSKCSACGWLGHLENQCIRPHVPRLCWRPKISSLGASTYMGPPMASNKSYSSRILQIDSVKSHVGGLPPNADSLPINHESDRCLHGKRMTRDNGPTIYDNQSIPLNGKFIKNPLLDRLRGPPDAHPVDYTDTWWPIAKSGCTLIEESGYPSLPPPRSIRIPPCTLHQPLLQPLLLRSPQSWRTSPSMSSPTFPKG